MVSFYIQSNRWSDTDGDFIVPMNHYVKGMTNTQEGWWIEIHL